jgi:hypothetical protein
MRTLPLFLLPTLVLYVALAEAKPATESEPSIDVITLPLDASGTDYLYAAIVVDAPIASGYFRGASLPLWQGQVVVELRSTGDEIMFIKYPPAYIQGASAEAQTRIANLSNAYYAVPVISSDGPNIDSVTIDAQKLFFSQALTQLSDPSTGASVANDEFQLGALNESKSRILAVRSSQDETTALVRYVFEVPSRSDSNRSFADMRQTIISVQHTFLRLKESDYKPRLSDSRVGYFVERKTDLTLVGRHSAKDYIRRWDLRKESAASRLSAPIQPIVFWIDDAVPLEYRDAVMRGVLAWNVAFENAGFVDAIQVKNRPEDATWSFEDLSKNVIQWQLTPESWFGNGLSQTISDPRTGQIIAADVILDHRRILQFAQFATLMFPSSELSVAADLAKEATEQFVQELVLHEVGHALGLTHNFRGSRAYSAAQLMDPVFTEEHGISGSVMDLLPTNFSNNHEGSRRFHQTRPGPYDIWAIEFGYAEVLADPVEEELRMDNLLARAAEPVLSFGNDADVMWTPESGVDPTSAAWDNSYDAIAYAESRIQRIDEILDSLPERIVETGRGAILLHEAIEHLSWLRQAQVNIIAAYVGGIRKAQSATGELELIPVDRELQERALVILADTVFRPQAYLQDSRLIRQMGLPRRDFDLSGKTADPKIHSSALEEQKRILNRILSPSVLDRLADTSLYGGDYRARELFSSVTSMIFAQNDQNNGDDLARNNLRFAYTNQLCDIYSKDSTDTFSGSSKALALGELTSIYRGFSDTAGGRPKADDNVRLIQATIRKCTGQTDENLVSNPSPK